MDLNIPVSGRELGRLTGQSEGAVRKAKNRFSIVKGLTADGKFYPLIASKEWGKPILPEFLKLAGIEVAVSKPEPAKPSKPKAEKPLPVKKQKPDPATFDEILKDVMSEKLGPLSEYDLGNINDDDPEETSDDVDKPEAERQAAILKVKILRLSYMEKRGQMVPITKVNSVNFSFGQEIRVALEGLPNRVLDKLLSFKTRHEAKKYFDKEINETLNLIADIQNRKFE